MSAFLFNMIDQILDIILLFYKSNFWKRRYYRRLTEEGILQSTYSKIKEINKQLASKVDFKTYKDKLSSNGVSWDTTIALNENTDVWEKDMERLIALIMHEFGHIQYNQPEFKRVVYLNELIFTEHTPVPKGLKTDSDITYFSDFNELRQRIIVVVYQMWENKWTAEETYEKVCKYDDIFDLYSKDEIIYWIDNIL